MPFHFQNQNDVMPIQNQNGVVFQMLIVAASFDGAEISF